MKCERFRTSMYLVRGDEGDDDDLAAPFHDHLSRCPACATRFEFLCRLFRLVRQRCQRLDAPDGLKTRIVAAFEHRRTTILE